MSKKVRVIALYLPQFHPIPENDEWWGKGFTEWTNVGKAKPLFKGHYQPRVPADLGYYDLRVPETRQAQADLAKEAGIEGFCYWHYWFGNGKRLLDRPFKEVLSSGKPDFPFCLAWANHTWKAKTWSPDKGPDNILIEQAYYGLDDYTEHFQSLLPAFLDSRYIRIKNKPMFLIWDPDDLPDAAIFINHWNKLARENGLEGIHFIASSKDAKNIDNFIIQGFDSVSLDLLADTFTHRSFLRKSWHRLLREIINIPQYVFYDEYINYFKKNMPISQHIFPAVIPNFDHSPRSGNLWVFRNSTPEKFAKLLRRLFIKLSTKDPETNVVILRSWNEWGEGNYMEPDLKFGHGYIQALKNELNNL
jgi:lipopolysaccharide biosynthesis protein